MSLPHLSLDSRSLEQIIDFAPITVLADALVSDVMTLMSQTQGSNCTLPEAGASPPPNWQRPKHNSCVLVMAGTQLVGMLTERDIVKLSAYGARLSGLRVAEVMTRKVITVTLSDIQAAHNAFRLLGQQHIKYLPVLDSQGQLLGLITPATIAHYLQSMQSQKLYRVAQVMTEVAHASGTASLQEIAQLMAKSRARSILIVEIETDAAPHPIDGSRLKPLGMITEGDIVRWRDLELNFAQVQAAQVMNAPLVCARPSDSLWAAQQHMLIHSVQRLVVLGERDELLGLVTQANVLQMLSPSEITSIVKALRHQIEEHKAETQTVDAQKVTFQPTNQVLPQELPARQRIQTVLNQWQAVVRTKARLKSNMLFQEPEHNTINLLEASPVAILGFDARGQCTYVNRRWSEITGQSPEAALGDGWWQVLHGDDQELVARTWQEWLQTGESVVPYQQDARAIGNDGKILWLELLIRPVLGAKTNGLNGNGLNSNGMNGSRTNGSVASWNTANGHVSNSPDSNSAGSDVTLKGYVSTVSDITERKQQDAAHLQLLADTEAAKLQVMAILESITDGVICFDQDWRFTSVNAQAGRILQRNPADLIGKYVWSEFNNVSDTSFYREYHRAVAEQIPVEFEEFYPPLNTWFAVHAYPTGNGLLSYFEDISARKQLELRIRELVMVLDVTSDAIAVIDLEDQLLYWNQGAERLYGWTATEAVRQNANQLLYRSIPVPAEVAQTVKTQGAWRGELQQVTKAGHEITVKSRWTLARDEAGNPNFILIVNADITEQKRLESQFLRAQRLESLGTLSGGMAHDLSNLFTPMLMATQLLQQQLQHQCPDGNHQELLQILEANARRGSELVQQVLTFTKGTEGKQIPLQPKHLLTEIQQICHQTFPKSITTTLDFPPDLAMISADAIQVHQAIMNLCVNARDAMPAGGQLLLSAENFFANEAFARQNSAELAGPYVVITVADTGIGMTPELVERIFEPFFTTKTTDQCSGLGLSIAHSIIDNHRGFITVKSKLGEGTQFQLYLPAITAPAASATPSASSGLNLPSGQGELILLVDDERHLLDIARLVLEGSNYRVLTARNGVDAIALFAQPQDKIDVVFMDMMMPDMGGQLAIQTIRKINADVKIIVSSGLPLSQLSIPGDKTGIQASLPKPYTAQDLLTTLDQVLKPSPVLKPNPGLRPGFRPLGNTQQPFI
jgi:PAS domain S-box-containing protein